MNGSSLNSAVQCHQGTVEVDHAPGYDASVRVAVPVRETTAEAGRADQPQAKPKRSLSILCIDDDLQVREFMTDCLAHFNHRVVVASGGKQGVELFRSASMENQPYDVVITDLGMPDLNGYQVARIIKAESPTTPVIMMTGWGTTMRDDGDTTPGVDIVVGKPPRMHELNKLILRMATPANLAGKEEG